MHPSHRHEHAHSSCCAPSQAKAMPERVIDPVCGMKIDSSTARGGSFAYGGETFYFCNPRCKEKFSAEPERYLKAEAPAAPSAPQAVAAVRPKRVAK